MAPNETIYGEGILGGELKNLDDYVVVTDEVPWQLYRNRLPREPVRVIMPGTLEQAILDEIAPEIPQGATIVGMGGGTVIDAAKYFAFLHGKTPILVPTITSSNTQFSDYISIRRGGKPVGMKKEGQQRRIVVDFSLIRTADARLNRAGYGDVLSMQTVLNDWRIAAAVGKTEPIDPALEEIITSMVQVAIENAAEIGSVTRRGIEVLMKLLEDYTELVVSNPSKPLGAGAEHLFAWNLEGVTGRHFVHGEIVSLGILITSYLQESNLPQLQEALQKARVNYLPEQLGIEWEEIEETLLTVKEYNQKARRLNTVFDEVEWTPHLLEEVKSLLYG